MGARAKTGVEIERSLIDAVHRSLFRSIWVYSKDLLDILVFLVTTYKEPKNEKVMRDVEAFKDILPYPILLLGISK